MSAIQSGHPTKRAVVAGFQARFTLALLCLLFSPPSWSDEHDVDPINYAFARYLGTGFYRAGGRSVWVLTVPWTKELEQPHEGAPGISFRLATTLGFYDFSAWDIVEGGLPEQVGTLSVLPGVMAHYPITDRWALDPFVDIGLGNNFSGGDVTYIYGMGLRSAFEFSSGDYDFLLGNRLLFAGNSATDTETAGNFSAFETLLDTRLPARMPIGEWDMDFSVYLANFLYSNLQLLDVANESNEFDVQWEAGFTAGPRQEAKLFGVTVPRLGLGYRYSQGFYAIRLFIGRPF